MKRKTSRRSIYFLLASYLGMVAIFLFTVYKMPTWLQNAEWKYINEIKQELKTTLESTTAENLSQQLQTITEKYPMELAVYTNTNKPKQIYQTLKGVDYQYLQGLQNSNTIIYEEEVLITNKTVNTTYRTWYSIAPPPATTYIQNLMQLQIILMLIVFAILLLISFILHRMLINPLKEIEAAIPKMEQFDFDAVEINSDDTISKSVAHFATTLKGSVSAVSRNHTLLEQELQLERERLSNMITISRGIIHDLKSPLHQTLIENDYYIKSQQEIAIETREIAQYNVARMDKMITQINEVLNLLDTNTQTMVETVDNFNLALMFKEIRKNFNPSIEQKRLLIDAVLDEDLQIQMNKVTARMIIHNLLSNAINYATKETEILFEIYFDEEQNIIIRCENETSKQNINRIRQSEELFAFVNVEDESGEHIYSTGNGLYLIKELAHLLNGEYLLETTDTIVSITIKLPN